MSELGTKYDAHVERIRALAEELEKEKEKLTSLVKQGEAVKAQQLEHLQKAESLGQFLDSRYEETSKWLQNYKKLMYLASIALDTGILSVLLISP